MQKTKLLTLSVVCSTLLLLTACGGGSSSDKETPTPTKITTVSQAKSSFKALSATNSFDSFKNALNSNNKQKVTLNKTTTQACDSGSLSVTEEGTTFNFVANQCRVNNYYVNGSINAVQLSNGSMKLSMNNLTMKDGEIEISANQLIFVENSTAYWSTIDGDIKIVSKCFSGSFNLTTLEKIYDAQDGSDNAESGILKMNGVTYTFNNPYVTIKTATEEETILQSELEKRMSNTTTCSE